MPCQEGRKAARPRWSAGSISLRSAASEARRRRRRTSTSHHSRSLPPGRSSPRTSSPARSSSRSTARRVDAVARAQLLGRERPVGARVARDELRAARRARPRGTPRAARPAGRRRARRGRARRRRRRCSAPRRRCAARPRGARARARRAAPSASMPSNTRSRDLRRGQVADAAQHVVQRVAAGRARQLGAVLQVVFDARQRARVDQLAQLLLAEQLAQQVAVERQRRGPALGVGRVALVHVGRDVVEQQRGGERRGGRGLDLDERDLARVQAAQQRLQARHVEHVAQALAVGLEHDREVGVARGRPRAGSGPSAAAATAACAGPDRRAGSAARGRRSRGSARRTAPSRRARRRPRARPPRARAAAARRRRGQRLGLLGVEVGQVQDDAVVGPDRVGLQAEALAHARGERQAPGGVDAAAVGREHAQAPVADLVAEALEHDRAVARQHARGVLLLAQVGEQVARRALVEVVVALRASRRPARPPSARTRRSPRPAPSGARPSRPSRTAPRRARRAPGVTITRSRPISSIRQVEAPSRNVWPGPRLVDHLLVELADAAPVGQRHGVQAAVGDRAGVGDRELARALARRGSCPATRSQTMRARSSPNSCDG